MKLILSISVFTTILTSLQLSAADLKLGRVSVEGLNVRPDPSTRNKEICVITKDQELTILETSSNGRWYKVRTKGVNNCGKNEGWVRSHPYFVPVNKPVAIERRSKGYVVKSKTGVEVSLKTQAGSSILCKFKKNDTVAIFGPAESSKDWYEVDLKSHSQCPERYGSGFIPKSAVEDLPSPKKQKNVGHRGSRGRRGRNAEDLDAQIEATVECEECLENKARETALTGLEIARKAEIEAYSNCSDVKKMLSYAIRKKRRRSHRECYKYVKRAIRFGGKLIPELYSDRHAKNAGPHLKEYGFENLMEDPAWKDKIKSPYDAPKGTILVYSGGASGHIEIKTKSAGQGGFVSDYFSEKARTGPPSSGLSGKKRTLIGVYYKLGVGQ